MAYLRSLAAALAVAATLAAPSAQAVSITPAVGNLTLTLIAPAGGSAPVAFDLDGSVIAFIDNPGGFFALTDAEGIGGVDPFPQIGLLAADDFAPTELAVITFDGTSILTLPALGSGTASMLGSAMPLGIVTNPNLLSVIANGPYTFEFAYLDSTLGVNFGLGALDFHRYAFTGASQIPEPGTAGLFGFGLLAAACLRRRKST